MQQASDFREESLTLKSLIADLDDAAFEKTTQFKSWTINDVFRHLHFWNKAVMVATEGDEAFATFFEGVGAHMMKGGSLPEYEKAYWTVSAVGRCVRRGHHWLTRWQMLTPRSIQVQEYLGQAPA